MTDEYIRREDVLKEKRTGTFPNGICLEAKACVTVEYIKSIQPADVVPVVHGKWIKEYRAKGQVANMCTECGGETGRVSNFCPNCGAKMDGERREE